MKKLLLFALSLASLSAWGTQRRVTQAEIKKLVGRIHPLVQAHNIEELEKLKKEALSKKLADPAKMIQMAIDRLVETQEAAAAPVVPAGPPPIPAGLARKAADIGKQERLRKARQAAIPQTRALEEAERQRRIDEIKRQEDERFEREKEIKEELSAREQEREAASAEAGAKRQQHEEARRQEIEDQIKKLRKIPSAAELKSEKMKSRLEDVFNQPRDPHVTLGGPNLGRWVLSKGTKELLWTDLIFMDPQTLNLALLIARQEKGKHLLGSEDARVWLDIISLIQNAQHYKRERENN